MRQVRTQLQPADEVKLIKLESRVGVIEYQFRYEVPPFTKSGQDTTTRDFTNWTLSGSVTGVQETYTENTFFNGWGSLNEAKDYDGSTLLVYPGIAGQGFDLTTSL